jgi:predicted RNA binding protein YcfA (HicA-like mRNA interferase family)
MPKITPVPYQTLVRVFEKDGFQLQRTRGAHLVYTKPGIPRPIVIPMYDQVPVFIIRTICALQE